MADDLSSAVSLDNGDTSAETSHFVSFSSGLESVLSAIGGLVFGRAEENDFSREEANLGDSYLANDLSSEDNIVVDLALEELDALLDPERIHRIVNLAIEMRGLGFRAAEYPSLNIEVVDQAGEVVGVRGLGILREYGKLVLRLQGGSLYSQI